MESPFRITPKVEESELPPLKRGIGESLMFEEPNLFKVERFSHEVGDRRERQHKMQLLFYSAPSVKDQYNCYEYTLP